MVFVMLFFMAVPAVKSVLPVGGPGLMKESNPSPSSSDEIVVATDTSEEGERDGLRGSFPVRADWLFECFGRGSVPFEVSFVSFARLTGGSSTSPSSCSTASMVRDLKSFRLGAGASGGRMTEGGGAFGLPSAMRPGMEGGLRSADGLVDGAIGPG